MCAHAHTPVATARQKYESFCSIQVIMLVLWRLQIFLAMFLSSLFVTVVKKLK